MLKAPADLTAACLGIGMERKFVADTSHILWELLHIEGSGLPISSLLRIVEHHLNHEARLTDGGNDALPVPRSEPDSSSASGDEACENASRRGASKSESRRRKRSSSCRPSASD